MTREELADLVGFAVSRETHERLAIYVSELTRWQGKLNLIGRATLADVWVRHISDSAQLAFLASGGSWLDLGAGAGLPGLVIAAVRDEAAMTLIESDERKCAFLRHAAYAMGLTTEIIPARIEAAVPTLGSAPNVVTARAVATLERLLIYAHMPLAHGATGLFPKGANYVAELTKARESWTFDADVIASRTDPHGRVLRIQNLRAIAPQTRRTGPQEHDAGI